MGCAPAGPPHPTDVPAHTRDPNDDAIVHGALLADSDFLISDDRNRFLDGEAHAHDYAHDGRRTHAVTFLDADVLASVLVAGGQHAADRTLRTAPRATAGPSRGAR